MCTLSLEELVPHDFREQQELLLLKTATCLLPCYLLVWALTQSMGGKFSLFSSQGKFKLTSSFPDGGPSTGLQMRPGWEAKHHLLCSPAKVTAARGMLQVRSKYSAGFTGESLATQGIKDSDPLGCSCKTHLICTWWVDRRVRHATNSCNLQQDFNKLLGNEQLSTSHFQGSETENGLDKCKLWESKNPQISKRLPITSLNISPQSCSPCRQFIHYLCSCKVSFPHADYSFPNCFLKLWV